MQKDVQESHFQLTGALLVSLLFLYALENPLFIFFFPMTVMIPEIAE